MEQSKLIRPSDTPPIPKRRIFMMGNGKPVQPRTAENFCGAIVNGCLDGDIISHYEFSLGFAACFDAISRGTIDLEADPIGIVHRAFADIENITTKPNEITDIMRVGDAQ